jgi:hypothetical protein
MTKMRFSLKENDAVFASRVDEAISVQMNVRIAAKRHSLVTKMKAQIGIWLRNTPELIELGLSDGRPGSLASQIGLPYGTAQSAVNSIVGAILASTEVKIENIDRKLSRGGVTLKCQPKDFANILGLPEVSISIVGGKLEWLRWLLERGNEMIVVGYEYSPRSGFGRSRGGVMTEGTSWRIPPSYSGTPDDNFITRAFSGKESSVQHVFQSIFGD